MAEGGRPRGETGGSPGSQGRRKQLRETQGPLSRKGHTGSSWWLTVAWGIPLEPVHGDGGVGRETEMAKFILLSLE